MKTFLQKIKLMIPAATALVMPASAKAIDIGNWGLTVKEDAEFIDTVQTVIVTFLWLAGVVTIIYLIYGGIIYITAGGDAEKAGTGKNAIIHAVIGIIIVVSAYAIFKYAMQIAGQDAGIIIPVD